MDKLRAVVALHSGGPTAVLNRSLAGILDACCGIGISRVAGVRFGVSGLLTRDWIDLSSLSREAIAGIGTVPGSILGSSRKKLEASDAPAAIASLRQAGFDCLLFTGGNGSMRTALLLHETAAAIDPDFRVIGVPKTIDNDLAVTDHTPGYGSCARFFALALRDIGADYRALPPPVGIVEVLGRNTGWVAAATALARSQPDDPPHLIYLPERPPTIEQICADVEDIYRRHGYAVVAVCEGLRDPGGQPFGAEVDRPGSRQHELASNLAHVLARAVTARTGLRARSEKPGLVGRSFSLAVSLTDAAESYLCGAEAVRAAAAGKSGVMVGLRRISQEPYQVEPILIPLEEVAGVERGIPSEWIVPAGNNVTSEFEAFVHPLIGELTTASIPRPS